MKVECKINTDYKEPYAVLHINKMTPVIAEIISILEREDTNAPALIPAGSEPGGCPQTFGGCREGQTLLPAAGFLTASKERKTYFIKPEELVLVRTEGREIVCYDKLKNRYVLDKPLYEWEAMLDSHFVRISKSAIINIRQIDHVEAGFNGTMEMVMKNGMTDYISRNFRKAFKERLGLK